MIYKVYIIKYTKYIRDKYQITGMHILDPGRAIDWSDYRYPSFESWMFQTFRHDSDSDRQDAEST
jgi:hypothetical protein